MVPQTDAGNRVIGYHDAVGARHAEDSRSNLEAGSAVVGVHQDGLDALLYPKGELALMGETQQMALHPLPIRGADFGLRALREYPAITAESVHDFVGGDKAIASRHAGAGVGCKCGLGECHCICIHRDC